MSSVSVAQIYDFVYTSRGSMRSRCLATGWVSLVVGIPVTRAACSASRSRRMDTNWGGWIVRLVTGALAVNLGRKSGRQVRRCRPDQDGSGIDDGVVVAARIALALDRCPSIVVAHASLRGADAFPREIVRVMSSGTSNGTPWRTTSVRVSVMVAMVGCSSS